MVGHLNKSFISHSNMIDRGLIYVAYLNGYKKLSQLLKRLYEPYRASEGQHITIVTALIEKHISLANGRKENQN